MKSKVECIQKSMLVFVASLLFSAVVSCKKNTPAVVSSPSQAASATPQALDSLVIDSISVPTTCIKSTGYAILQTQDWKQTSTSLDINADGIADLSFDYYKVFTMSTQRCDIRIRTLNASTFLLCDSAYNMQNYPGFSTSYAVDSLVPKALNTGFLITQNAKWRGGNYMLFHRYTYWRDPIQITGYMYDSFLTWHYIAIMCNSKLGWVKLRVLNEGLLLQSSECVIAG